MASHSWEQREKNVAVRSLGCDSIFWFTMYSASQSLAKESSKRKAKKKRKQKKFIIERKLLSIRLNFRLHCEWWCHSARRQKKKKKKFHGQRIKNCVYSIPFQFVPFFCQHFNSISIDLFEWIYFSSDFFFPPVQLKPQFHVYQQKKAHFPVSTKFVQSFWWFSPPLCLSAT